MDKNERSKRKKILIFTPGGLGGAERMSVLIGKILPIDRFEVKFVVIGRLRNVYNIIPDKYDVDCIPIRNILDFSTFRIWCKIKKESPDIVFTSQSAFNSRVIIAARLAGKKVVARSSGMLGKYSKLKQFEVKLFYPFAHLLIAQQDDMRDEMIRLLKVKSNKVITIHNPIDTNEIDAFASEKSPFPIDECVKYVQVASVCHRKAQDVSIKAFHIVRQSLKNAHLYFVGDYHKNEYFLQLESLISDLHLKDYVHFMGFTKNPFSWVKNSDCFVLSSRAEGLPNALVEASYLGVPCVATRCLSIVDNIIKDGQNGYVVDVDDINGLASSMVKAIKLKECQMVFYPGSAKEFANLFDSI